MVTIWALGQENECFARPAVRRRAIKSKPTIQGISKGDIKRLARKGGVIRVSTDIYTETRDSIRLFLKHIVKKSLVYMLAAKRKTCRPLDLVMALKKYGRSLYGFI